MKELKPKLIIAGSNKKKRGGSIGYLLTLVLVFAVGVYVGTKIDDTGFSGDQLIGNSPDHSQMSQNAANKGPEVVEKAANTRKRDLENEISNISSDSDTVTKSDIIDHPTADSPSNQSQLEENNPPLDGQQLQDVTAPESSETKVALINELSNIAEPGSEGGGLPEINIYRLQVAAFENLDDANEVVSELRDKGYDAYIVQSTNSREEDWNLIKVGKFETAQEAWNFSTLYQSKEGGDVFVESLQRGRVYNESLEQENTKE